MSTVREKTSCGPLGEEQMKIRNHQILHAKISQNTASVIQQKHRKQKTFGLCENTEGKCR